jgi:hypothetical protein
MCAKSSSSSSYCGSGEVSNLGNYTNSPETKMSQKSKNRESVLNTLINGSQIPNDIKKCSELISTANKKGIKTKSES